MNRILERLLLLYTTAPRSEWMGELSAISRPTLEATFLDLLTLYFNDRNSSTLREWVTLTIAGYRPLEQKLGYNGYRQVGPGPHERDFCEVKPVNVRYDQERRRGRRRLRGQGSFSDYTPERFWKDMRQGVHMLVSGFVT